MQKAIDLQMHSHYSDGSKSPTELIDVLVSKHIVVASLTDHNTIHGQYEFQAAAKAKKIKTITGVEIYTDYKKFRLHLLGYNIDINSAALHDALRDTQIKRKKQIEQLVPRLKRIGITLNISELFAQPATYIGVANVVRTIERLSKNRAVIQKLAHKRQYDFFEVYNAIFSKNAPCYLPEIAVPMRTAIRLIKNAGGVPVISHPGWQLSFHNDHIIGELKKLGLAGIECFSSHHNWDQTAHYQNVARQYSLVVTGGSDYHGDLPGDAIIENYHEYTSLPFEIYEKIKLF